MARRSVVVLECDKCGAEISPDNVYPVTFPEGVKEFMLCDKHNTQILRLRDADYGTWKKAPARRGRKRGINKVDLAEVKKRGGVV